eukprot:TRINITY_DN43_c0_g2_i1.p3 TRINITY_DN43_c0_g2~~TRINITY_DN43_c0_g2_i1.p3  ORF type:complete len:54 (+),score=6.36 TRINITY_DN43_c0_g2_i1:206-367(+)
MNSFRNWNNIVINSMLFNDTRRQKIFPILTATAVFPDLICPLMSFFIAYYSKF